MIILALDSGLEKTGYAFFDKDVGLPQGYRYLTSGLVTTKKLETNEKRLKILAYQVEKLIQENQPNKIILEQLFFFKNQKTVIAVAQAQGAIMLLAGQKNIPIVTLTPLQIKQIITGYGNADKQSIQKMLTILLPQIKKITQDDEADAVACGLAYCCLNENLVK